MNPFVGYFPEMGLGVLLLSIFLLCCVKPTALGKTLSFISGLAIRGSAVTKLVIDELHVGAEPKLCGLEIETKSRTIYQPEILLKWSKCDKLQIGS